jgi:hypothetical protein
LIVWEHIWAWRHLRAGSGNALSSLSLEFSTCSLDSTLEVCWDEFECGHHMDWVRFVCGGATCTLVLVYMSIKVRESQ